MIKINNDLQPADLKKKIDRLWELSAPKIWSISKDDQPRAATPVYTVRGKYTSRGWTEWTQGFVYGSAILQFDAVWDESFFYIDPRARSPHRAGARPAPTMDEVGQVIVA